MTKTVLLLITSLACGDHKAAVPPAPRTVDDKSPAAPGSRIVDDKSPAAAPGSRIVDEQAAFEKARAEHKGVMIVFDAAWCMPCVELAKNLRDKQVAPLVDAGFVPLTFDVSNGTDTDRERQERYGASTLPAIVFVAPRGDVVGRVDRLLDPPELAESVRAAAAKLAR